MQQQREEAARAGLAQAEGARTLVAVAAEHAVEPGKQRREVRARAVALMVTMVKGGRRQQPGELAGNRQVGVHEDGVEPEQEQHARMRGQWDIEKHQGRILDQCHQYDLERMLPERGEPIERSRGVMDRVQPPQAGHSVGEPVVAIAHQLEYEQTQCHIARGSPGCGYQQARERLRQPERAQRAQCSAQHRR